MINGYKKLGKSKQIALSGIICALCVALMFSTGLMPILTYAVPALTGYVLFLLTFEAGFQMSIVAYFVVSFLSIITTPDKMAAIIFILFFGYYGIVKTRIDRLKSKFLKILLKILIFNSALTLTMFLSIKITGLDEIVKGFEFLGLFVFPLAYLAANIFLIVYEISLNQLKNAYMVVLRPMYFKTKK